MKNHGNKNFKLKIKNFGPISFGDFNINPLTVFTGPNNSGKSFASLIFHSLTNYNSFQPLDGNWKDHLSKNDEKYINDLESSFSEEIYDKIKKYLKSKPDFNSKPFLIPIGCLKPLYEKIINRFFLKQIENNMTSFFSEDLSKLILKDEKTFDITFNQMEFILKENKFKLKSLSAGFSVSIEFKDEDILKCKNTQEGLLVNLEYKKREKTLKSLLNDFDFSKIDNTSENFEELLKKQLYNDPESVIAHEYAKIIFDSIIGTNLMNISKLNSYYVPVGKTEIIHDLKTVVAFNITDNDFGYSQAQKSLTKDFIKIDFNKKGDFYQLAEELEQELLSGSIEVKIENDIPKFSFLRDDDLKIPSDKISSSISELTPIILYLKHFLKKGDILIIEEPESHLHPKNQRIFIKHLIRAINNGLNVLLTTHSDYLIDQINNHIMLNNISDNKNLDKIMGQYDYNKDDLLDSDLVSVYALRSLKNKKYSFKSHELEITETGIKSSDMLKIANDLYDESYNIKDLLMR
jgi:predicted ATPase